MAVAGQAVVAGGHPLILIICTQVWYCVDWYLYLLSIELYNVDWYLYMYCVDWNLHLCIVWAGICIYVFCGLVFVSMYCVDWYLYLCIVWTISSYLLFAFILYRKVKYI